MDEPRQIAIVRDYREFVEALDARAAELKVSRETIDTVAGIPNGYAGKALVWPPIRKLGRVSLGPLLEVLGLTLVFVENKEALDRLKHRLPERAEDHVRSGAKEPPVEIRFSRKKLRVWGARGGRNRAAKMTKKQHTKWARRANRIRWRKARDAAKG